MIVADEHGVDVWQIIDPHSRVSSAPRTYPGNRAGSFRPNWVRQNVGSTVLDEHGRVVHQSLGNEGRGLIHSIGRNRPAPMHPWIEKRIFPGAYPPALSEMMRIFEPWNLSVLDVENIRLHYARTLQHWMDLYENASGRVAEMFDEKFVRMWRLYLAGSLAAFTTGTLQLFQVVFAPGGSNNVPWTRDYLYSR